VALADVLGFAFMLVVHPWRPDAPLRGQAPAVVAPAAVAPAALAPAVVVPDPPAPAPQPK
jgi:hypothetical protein